MGGEQAWQTRRRSRRRTERTGRIGSRSVLAPGYQIEPLGGEEIGSTGRLKVLRVSSSDEPSPAPRFLGRWDDGREQCLGFDLGDRNDKKAHIRKLPYGHHPDVIETTDGHRRYQVEIGPDENNIVFKGVVELSLGFRMHLGDVLGMVDELKAELIYGARTGPESAETGGQP